MKMFLEQLTSIDNTLKETILALYQALLKQGDSLRASINPDLFLEHVELEKTIITLDEIIKSTGTVEHKCEQLERFLQTRWHRIKDTGLSYPYCPTLVITQYCHAIARLLHALQGNDCKRSIYNFLMPTLNDKYTINHYEIDETLDQQPLGRFILDSTGTFPIPLKVLDMVLQLKRKSDFIEAEQCKRYNPYHPTCAITEHEWGELVLYSKQGIKAYEACNQYLNIYAEPDNSIGDALTTLMHGLQKGSSKAHNENGSGSTLNAGIEATSALAVFQYYLDSLSETQRKIIFTLHPGPNFSAKYTFEHIWWLLTNPDAATAERDTSCAGLHSRKIKAILELPESKNLFSSIKAEQLKQAEKQMDTQCELLQLSVDEVNDLPEIPFQCYRLQSDAFILEYLQEYIELANINLDPTVLKGKIAGYLSRSAIQQIIIREGLVKSFELAIQYNVNKNNLYYHRVFATNLPVNVSEFDNILLDSGFNQQVFWSGINRVQEMVTYTIESKSIAMIQRIVDVNGDKYYKNEGGQRLLHLLAHNGYQEAVFLLMIKGSDITVVDGQSVSAAFFAIDNGHDKLLADLIEFAPNLINQTQQSNDTPLTYASYKGHLQCVDLLISRKANLDTLTDQGCSALALAIRKKYPDIIKLLINAGADVNAGKQGNTPLDFAILNKDSHSVTLLREKQVQISKQQAIKLLAYAVNYQCDDILSLAGEEIQLSEQQAKELHSAVMNAIQLTNITVVSFIRRNNQKILDINRVNEEGQTLLHAAATHRNALILCLLLKKENINLNIIDKYGYTALTLAIKAGDLLIARKLINVGANIHKGGRGKTPLDMAIKAGCWEMAELLSLKKARISNSFIAFSSAISNGNKILFDYLIDTKDIDCNDQSGQGLLHVAAQKCKASIDCKNTFVDILLKKGIDTTAVDTNGNTAALFAATHGYFDILKAFIESNPLCNKPNKMNETPLLLAISHGQVQCAEFLVSTKTNLNTITDQGKTALTLAIECQYFSVACALIEAGADVNAGIQANTALNLVIKNLSRKNNNSWGNSIDDKNSYYWYLIKLLGDKQVQFSEQHSLQLKSILADEIKMHIQAIEYLFNCNNKAILNILLGDSDEKSLFEIARENYNQRIMDLLLAKKAEVIMQQQLESSTTAGELPTKLSDNSNAWFNAQNQKQETASTGNSSTNTITETKKL